MFHTSSLAPLAIHSTKPYQGVNVLGETVLGVHGKPSEAILQFAEEHGCDLIAMASHDRNLLEELLKGSVTSEVIRSSRVPIIAMTPERMPERPDPNQPVNVSSLSVLLDGSEFAEAALPYVKDLASRLSLEIVLMRWLSGEQLDLDLVGTGNEPPDIDMIQSQTGQAIPEEAKEAIQYLRDKTNELLAEGFSARWEIPRMTADSVHDELMQGSARNMIVLASHGRSRIFRWLEGSVAEELLKEPGGPLLIIPAALADRG